MPLCSLCGERSAAGARFCPLCGARLRESTPPRRRIATAVFCDVVESTALGERLDAEAVLQLMLRYFDEARSALEGHGGTVEKFIGDAVVGIFGVAVAREDDALRAVRAAAEIRARLVRLNADLQRRHGAAIDVRIGVNTGEVAFGEDPHSGGSLVIADAMNVAARLEQGARAGEILLSDETYRLVVGAVVAEPVAPVDAKGKRSPIRAHRLLDVLDGARTPRPRSAAPLVGRRDELEVLTRAFREVVTSGRARVVTVVGDAGVGKSRLAHELCLRASCEATTAWGSTPSYGDRTTYRALGQALREAAGIAPADSPEDASSILRLRAGDTADGARVAETVGEAIGLRDGSATSDEIWAAVRTLLERLARRRPLVVVFDDIHWAQPAFLDLLRRLDGAVTARLLIVCLGRPDLLELRPEWDVAITLGPLDRPQASALIHALAGPALEPAERRIAVAAEGNPLFIEQLVAMLDERGPPGDRRTRDGSHVAALGPLPVGLNMLLTARLDRLPDAERTAAERASVEGGTFHVGGVCAVWPDEPPDRVRDALDALVRRGVAEPAPARLPGETALRFRHILLREAAYRGLSKSLRADLHARFARWLEGRTADRRLEHEEVLGHHLEQAYALRAELGPPDDDQFELGRRAAELLGAVGRRALARGEVDAAAGLLERARAVLPGNGRAAAEIAHGLGAALTELGETERAEALLASTAADPDADTVLRERARLELAWVRTMRAPDVAGSEMGRIAEALARTSDMRTDDLLVARAFHMLGVHQFGAELHARATEAFDRAIAYARRVGDGRTEADAMYLCGCATFFGPAPADDVLPQWEARLADSDHRPAVEAAAATGLALLLALLDRCDEARRLIARTFDVYEDLGMAVHRAGNEYSLAEVELLAGDRRAAAAAARSGYERFRALGDRTFASGGALYLASIADDDGRFIEAAALLAEGERLAGDDDVQTSARAAGLRSRAIARDGAPDRALTVLDDALGTLHPSEAPGLFADLLVERARVLRAASREHEARDDLATALSLFERKGNRPATRRTRALMARDPTAA